MLQFIGKFRPEIIIVAIPLVFTAQIFQSRNQRLGNEHPAIGAEVPSAIRKIINVHWLELLG